VTCRSGYDFFSTKAVPVMMMSAWASCEHGRRGPSGVAAVWRRGPSSVAGRLASRAVWRRGPSGVAAV
jgi:hypothetical protein